MFCGAPTSLAQNSAAAESEGGQKFLPPNPLPFCPPERSVWHAKRAVSSVQKRFGFRQTNAPTAYEESPRRLSLLRASEKVGSNIPLKAEQRKTQKFYATLGSNSLCRLLTVFGISDAP